MNGNSQSAAINLIGGAAIAQTPDVINPETSEYVVETDQCLHIRAIVISLTVTSSGKANSDLLNTGSLRRKMSVKAAE